MMNNDKPIVIELGKYSMAICPKCGAPLRDHSGSVCSSEAKD
jgi:hypothetical protein